MSLDDCYVCATSNEVEKRIKEYSVDQSKHSHYCEIQGPHSLGYGKQEDCDCGLNELFNDVLNVIELNSHDVHTPYRRTQLKNHIRFFTR